MDGVTWVCPASLHVPYISRVPLSQTPGPMPCDFTRYRPIALLDTQAANVFCRTSGVPTPMKGITTYSLSQNRQRPAAGMLYNAFFNTYRRAKAQVLYVLPPFIAAYALMDWATKKYV